jgi:hypothetical protein
LESPAVAVKLSLGDPDLCPTLPEKVQLKLESPTAEVELSDQVKVPEGVQLSPSEKAVLDQLIEQPVTYFLRATLALLAKLLK